MKYYELRDKLNKIFPYLLQERNDLKVTLKVFKVYKDHDKWLKYKVGIKFMV